MEKIFEGSYELTKEMLTDAYREYGKKMFVFRNVMTIIYIILGLYFLFLGIFREENKMCFVLAFVSLAIGFISWYNPRKARKNVIEVFDEIIGDKYECRILENSAEIKTISLADHTEDATDEEIEKAEEEGRTGIETTVFNFDKDTIVIEKNDYYIIGNKTVFFVLPKSGFENTQELTEFFSNKFGKDYKLINN